MQARSKAMKARSGNIIYLKFAADRSASDSEKINGSRAMTNMTIMIIILNAIIRYLNFNGNTPKMALNRIIRERALNVNLGNMG